MSYSLTVNIEAQGTPMVGEDHPALVGHIWYSLNDGDGHTYNYGFGPSAQSLPEKLDCPGKLTYHDDEKYDGDPKYHRTIEISEEQYNKTF